MSRTRPDRAVLVGCGLIGSKRAASLPDSVRLEGVFDVDPGRAATVAATSGASVAGDLDSLLAVEPGALVLVSTVHDALAPIASSAISAGHHVLVEKPGARTAAEFLPVVEVARDRGLEVRVGYNHRFHPSFVRVREWLERGDPGPLLNIRARYGHGGRLGYETEWRADRDRSGGGELLDQGSHLLDLSRMFCPDLGLVFSELATQFWAMDVEDNAWLALRSSGGAFAWLHATWTEWKNLFSFEVTYRHVKFEVTGLGGSYGPERLVCHEMLPEMGPPKTTSWEFDGVDESWGLEMVDVLDACAGLPSAGASADDALAVLRLIEEAYEA